MSRRSLVRSFGYAIRGFLRAVRGERNLRIHLTAVAYVIAFAVMAQLERGEWAILCLCFGLVIGLELLNTAVEGLCDAIRPERDPRIAFVKDAAAGGVLAAAAASVAVGLVIFTRGELWERIGAALLHPPVGIVLLIVSVPFALCWVRGPWKQTKRGRRR